MSSTVAPGATDWVAGYIEQKRGLVAGRDIFVAHVPERIAENHFLEEIETLVTKPIEDAIASVNGIKNVTSQSQEGSSNISIEFFLGIDPKKDKKAKNNKKKKKEARKIKQREGLGRRTG